MLRNLPVSVFALLVVTGSCARHTIPPVVLVPQRHIGAADEYGLSVADVTARDIDFTLEKPAYVVALRVTEGGVWLIAPLSGAPRSKSGAHYLRAGDGVSWVERSSYWTWTPAFSLPCAGPADTRSVLGFEGCSDFFYSSVPRVEYRTRVPIYEGEANRDGYWVLIASDTRIPTAEIRRRLEGVDRSDTLLVDVVRRIPERLLGSRTSDWAAYYAPFGDARLPERDGR